MRNKFFYRISALILVLAFFTASTQTIFAQTPRSPEVAITGSNPGTGINGGDPGTGARGGDPGTGITGSTPDTIPTLKNPLKVDSIAGLVKNFVEIFSYIVVLLAVLALIYVGLQFILAQGKPDKLTELKKWLFYIIIGAAIVIGARVIVDIVIGTLEASKTVSPDVIQSAKSANLR